MKKLLSLIGLLLLGAGLLIGGVLLFSESPMKTVESFAMQVQKLVEGAPMLPGAAASADPAR